MERARGDSGGRSGRRFTSSAWAAIGAVLLIYSVDRLFDTWATGPTWRIGLYAVIAAAALGGLIAGLRRPPTRT